MWFKNVIFNLALLIGIFKSFYDNVISWMPQDLTDDKSTLVQVMAWCHQATSHYLNQCWPRSPTPYGVTRPRSDRHSGCCHIFPISPCQMISTTIYKFVHPDDLYILKSFCHDNIMIWNAVPFSGPFRKEVTSGTNFSETLINIQYFSFQKMQLKMLSAK